MMKDMSKDGKLSKLYTNHCIRKTCVVMLDDAGFSPKDITVVTGHKAVQSLAPYLGAPNQEKKKKGSAMHSLSAVIAVMKQFHQLMTQRDMEKQRKSTVRP